MGEDVESVMGGVRMGVNVDIKRTDGEYLDIVLSTIFCWNHSLEQSYNKAFCVVGYYCLLLVVKCDDDHCVVEDKNIINMNHLSDGDMKSVQHYINAPQGLVLGNFTRKLCSQLSLEFQDLFNNFKEGLINSSCLWLVVWMSSLIYFMWKVCVMWWPMIDQVEWEECRDMIGDDMKQWTTSSNTKILLKHLLIVPVS